VRKPFCFPIVISRSSSSSLGSSLMRLRSFGPWSPRLERLSDTPRDLVDHGGLLVEHSQLFVWQRRRCAGLGLDVGDRLTHLARPPEPLAALEALLELLNANPDVNLHALFDEEGGQDAPRLVGGEVGHQALRRGSGPEPEGPDDRAERAMGELLGLHDHGQERLPRLGRVEQERDQVALDGWGRRGRRRGARRHRGAAQRRLQALGLDPELRGVHAELLGGLARELRRLLGIGDLREHQRRAGERVGPRAWARGAVRVGDGAVEGVGEEAPRCGDPLLERGGAALPEERVGVVARRQERDAQPQRARGLDGAGAVDGPRHARARGFEQLLGALRRVAAGRVGVEEQYRLVAVTLEEAELRRSEGSAQRGDRLGEGVLVGHEAIHVPFDQQRTVLRLDRGAREVGGVEQVALGVERCLGRVEILGLLVAEGAAAEGDDVALEIADREEEAAAESIVDARAALTRDREARGDEHVFRDLLGFHEARECVPALGRQPQAEAAHHLGVDPALVQVLPRALTRRLRELVHVEVPGQRHGAEELLAAAVAPVTAAVLGECHARLLGERAHGLGKRELVLAHQEAERVAAHATPEAVEDPLPGIDHEGRSLLHVEGTEAFPVLTGLLQIHKPADQVDDVDRRADLVERRLGVGRHAQLTFSAATVAPAPPSAGSPLRKESTSGWAARRSRTALRRAPEPLPWIKRTLGRPARNASSRYFSTASRASSVVRPSRRSSDEIWRGEGAPSFARNDTRTEGAPSPRPLTPSPPAGRRASRGTRTVSEPDWTVAVLPAIASNSPRMPRCSAATV